MQYEERETGYSRLQRWKHYLFATVICLMTMFVPFPSEAATVDFNAKMTELQNKFPKEKYWNHVGQMADNPDGYTDTPCPEELHKRKTEGLHTNGINGKNGCTCNHFTGHNVNGFGDFSATQCVGFAYKLGNEVFGATTWTRHLNAGSAYLEIVAGDVVNISGHTAFVTGKVGNKIYVAEANYTDDKHGCQIAWGREIDLTTVIITNYDRADNYAVVLGDVPVPPTTEATTTEATTQATTQVTGSTFQKAKDGAHNCYYENGKLVKKQWFSVDGKDYYANEDGLILVSQWLYKGNALVYVKADGSVARKELVNINGNTYFFKANGKRSAGWKKYDGKYYYCTKKGIVLKKQWIIKGRKRYYVQKDGSRAQNKYVKIKGRRYYFNRSGKMVAGR